MCVCERAFQNFMANFTLLTCFAYQKIVSLFICSHVSFCYNFKENVRANGKHRARLVCSSERKKETNEEEEKTVGWQFRLHNMWCEPGAKNIFCKSSVENRILHNKLIFFDSKAHCDGGIQRASHFRTIKNANKSCHNYYYYRTASIVFDFSGIKCTHLFMICFYLPPTQPPRPSLQPNRMCRNESILI